MISEAIKSLYEFENLEVEDIADQLEMTVESVKISLLQNSPRFRSKIKNNEAKDFTSEELETSKQALSRLMYSEDPHLAFKAAKFVFEVNTGRNNPKSLIKNINLNVNLINTQMQNALAAKEKALKSVEVKTLELVK